MNAKVLGAFAVGVVVGLLLAGALTREDGNSGGRTPPVEAGHGAVQYARADDAVRAYWESAASRRWDRCYRMENEATQKESSLTAYLLERGNPNKTFALTEAVVESIRVDDTAGTAAATVRLGFPAPAPFEQHTMRLPVRDEWRKKGDSWRRASSLDIVSPVENARSQFLRHLTTPQSTGGGGGSQPPALLSSPPTVMP